MSEETTKLYNTGMKAINIPAYGIRQPGEFWEMGWELAARYAEEHASMSLYPSEVVEAEALPEDQPEDEVAPDELDTLFSEKPKRSRRWGQESTAESETEDS